MKTFVITIERQMFQTHDLEIEAEDADEARELAEEEIPNIAPDGWDPGLETPRDNLSTTCLPRIRIRSRAPFETMNLTSSPSEIEEVARPARNATGAWRKRLTLREGLARVRWSRCYLALPIVRPRLVQASRVDRSNRAAVKISG